MLPPFFFKLTFYFLSGCFYSVVVFVWGVHSVGIHAVISPQDPNEDTEWNDILRKKGILPPKEIPKDDEEEELALQQQSVGKRQALDACTYNDFKRNKRLNCF